MDSSLGGRVEDDRRPRRAHRAADQTREKARAEATYRLGLVAEALGTNEPKGAKLARDYFAEVVQRNPGSHWAQKALERLPQDKPR